MIVVQEPIYSSFATDPDMVELVEIFVAEVPDKVALFQELWSQQSWGELKRAAHQLKGSAGGYGFDCLTPFAQELEYALAGEPSPEQVWPLCETLIAHLQALRV